MSDAVGLDHVCAMALKHLANRRFSGGDPAGKSDF